MKELQCGDAVGPSGASDFFGLLKNLTPLGRSKKKKTEREKKEGKRRIPPRQSKLKKYREQGQRQAKYAREFNMRGSGLPSNRTKKRLRESDGGKKSPPKK